MTDHEPHRTKLPGEPLGLPRTYWLLWGGMLFNRLGGSVFMLLALYLTRERGLSLELAGLVIGLYAAGGIVGAPLGGLLADRVGRRATLLIGTACAGTFMLALGVVRSISAFVILAPLLGLFTDLCRPPLQAAVADVVSPAQRQRAFGLLYWAINLGFAGAAWLGGALAERHFGALFVIDALTTFGYGAVVLLGVPETRPAPRTAEGGTLRRPPFAEPFRDGRYMTFVGIQLLLLLAFVQVLVALPLDMRAHGLSTGQIGWLLGLNGIYIVIGQPLVLRLVRGRSAAHWLGGGAALTGLGLGATALAGGPLVYALAAALWTLGEIGFSTGAPTLIAEVAPERHRGVYNGAYQLAWSVATALAPALGSFVLARFGGRTLWVGCLFVGLIAAVLHLAFTGRQRRTAPD